MVKTDTPPNTAPQNKAQRFHFLITSESLLPNVVRNRNMGEPNTYVLAGLDANKPTGVKAGNVVGVTMFWAWDSKKLYIFNPGTGAYSYVQFT